MYLFQKISYTTLCALLEYIYTGEVLISIDNLNELLEAGKELHVKGLEDMVCMKIKLKKKPLGGMLCLQKQLKAMDQE